MPFNGFVIENNSESNVYGFISMKCRFAETVHRILNGEKHITIDGVYTLDDKLKIDNIVFVTLGGDTGKKEVDWTPGFYAIAHVTREPYDYGYDGRIKYFKFDLAIDIIFPKVLKREDFINYRNAFNAQFIGPELSRDQTQALGTLDELKAVSVIRCVIDTFPELEAMVEDIFPIWFMEKVRQPIPMLIPVNVKYKHLIQNFRETGRKILDQDEIPKEIVRLTGASNILYYGVPGSGKSYKVTKALKKLISQDKGTREEFSRRIVFHPDYTYSDFVGQIMPVLCVDENGEKKVKYDFVAGPFAEIMQIAYENPEKNCVLVIEELNRGNAPAVFGEIFQLLDRDESKGESEYGIHNKELAKYIYDLNDEEASRRTIRIPSNLSIIATMNTSDQNVFAMDTAFQRRWQMRHIPNRFDGYNIDHASIEVCETHIPWGIFAQTVNDTLANDAELSFGMSSNEDKALGVYFATEKDLANKERFAEKVLKYLWDDAFKMGRDKIFKAEYKTLTNVIETFEACGNNALEKVINKDVYDKMVKRIVTIPADEMAAEAQENVEEISSTNA